MSIDSEAKPLSLAERIAKVRNRMLVAISTKASPSNKELFTTLCQIYEQQNAEKSSFSSELSDDLSLSLQALSFAHKVEGGPRQQWPECVLTKKPHPGKVEDFKGNVEDDDDDFEDWNRM